MTSGLDRRKQSFRGAALQITERCGGSRRVAPQPTANRERHKSPAQKKIESEAAEFLILLLNVRRNPAVHTGGGGNSAVDEYIAVVL